MHSGSPRPSSRIYIDITDEDETEAEILVKCRKEVVELRSQVNALQEENSALKLELNATHLELGRAVVANKMQVNYPTTKNVKHPAPSSRKRPRSPSLEPVHTPRVGKSKVKEEPKRIKIEQTSPSQKKLFPAMKPIIRKAECFSVTQSDLGLKRTEADCPLTSSSQPSLNPCSSAARPSQSVCTSPLIASERKSSRLAASKQKTPVRHGEHNLNILRLGHRLKKYLESAPTLPIPPRTFEARVKRKPFADYYGGSSQHFLQYIPSGNNPSGDLKRNLVFPQPYQNPFLPVGLGEPGLIFASRHEVANGSPWSLFVKHDPSVAIWTYLGDYKGEICGELTADQFKMLSKTQQDPWIDLLLTQKSGVYFTMRIRIALRKKGLIPLDDKAAEEKLIAEWKSRESDFDVIEEDVRTALYEGQEVIDLILMSCISYDYVFANDIRRNFTESGTRRPASSVENHSDSSDGDVSLPSDFYDYYD